MMTTKGKRLVGLGVALTSLLAVGAIVGAQRDATAVGTTPVVPTTVACPVTDPACNEDEPVPDESGAFPAGTFATVKTGTFGAPVEIRPDVFATAVAKKVMLPVGQTGAVAPFLEMTVKYENRTKEALQSMGGFAAVNSAATLAGEQFVVGWEGRSEAMSNVFPGRTGTVTITLQAPFVWDPAQEIQATIGAPALLSEGANVQNQPGNPGALLVGVPVS